MSAQASFHRLGADHLPFDASLDAGVARYGIGPLFHLWNVCRQIHKLRIEWVGDQTAEETPVPMVEA